MFFRKLRSASSMADRGRYPFKDKITQITSVHTNLLKYSIYLIIFLLLWFLFLFFWFPSTKTVGFHEAGRSDGDWKLRTASSPVCQGSVSVYVYELPARFNDGLLRDCRHLNVYTDMCPHVSNRGLGQPLLHMGPSWFATHQFIAEMIFHARVENHPCRTWEADEATLFYVPFYGGLHASSNFREPDLVARDRLAIELVEYLRLQSWWQKNYGRDHFLVLGRTAWDFMRADGAPDFGANCLLNLPHVKNMSVLTVERHPWEGRNQYGIPYPSYFHPSSRNEMLLWQDKVRRSSRPHLFSFVGAPRTGVQKAAIRDEILQQCAESTRCNLLKCSPGASKCHDPSEVIKVMLGSRFCMQAPGDSFTRRSTFDSVLAGCIPVFFSPHTAYSQYTWYLPGDPSEYSVYIPEGNAERIEDQLVKIPIDKVERMQSRVIDLIPTLTYVHPNATDIGFPDAVDIALEEMSKHVQSKLPGGSILNS